MQRTCSEDMTMTRRSIRVPVLAGLLLMSVGLPLAGCTPFHTTRRIQLEVVDALTGQPSPDVAVRQMVATSKFERPLVVEAISDERGSLTIDAIGTARDSYWWVGRDGPAYLGRGDRQLPTEFREVTRDDGTAAFVAPAWPTMALRIELPEGFKGLVMECPIRQDVQRSSGWMPTATVPSDDARVAVARATIAATADAGALVAYPTSIGGVSGFVFERGTVLLRGHTPLQIVDAGGSHARSRPNGPSDPSDTFAWVIHLAMDLRDEPSATGMPFAPDGVRMWFVGTEVELYAWLDGARLTAADPDLATRDPLAGRRQVTFFSALPILRRSWTGQLSDAPEWTTQSTVRAEYEALAAQASKTRTR